MVFGLSAYNSIIQLECPQVANVFSTHHRYTRGNITGHILPEHHIFYWIASTRSVRLRLGYQAEHLTTILEWRQQKINYETQILNNSLWAICSKLDVHLFIPTDMSPEGYRHPGHILTNHYIHTNASISIHAQ